MPILDFFRGLFGGHRTTPTFSEESPCSRSEGQRSHGNDFRNPIWQTDNDDNDDDDISYFSQQPRNGFQFRVFSDPFEMSRFFENQMDDMLKTFFNGFGGFGNGSNVFTFDNTLPMPQDTPKRPRDEVLKPSYDQPNSFFLFDDFTDMQPAPYNKPNVLKPAFEMPDGNNKLDSDIDGKIKSNELAKLWKNPSEDVESFQPQSSMRSFGKSVSTQIVRRADGGVEQRRTVRDSDGNEETTITRRIGDKVHTVVTKKNKNGFEEKSEDIINMEENELAKFDEKWTRNLKPEDKADDFPWYKFFGPNPKL